MSTDALQAEVNRLRLEVQTLQARNDSEPIEIGNYLLARLEQLNVKARPASSDFPRFLILYAANVRRAW
jgi:hypothetical protein